MTAAGRDCREGRGIEGDCRRWFAMLRRPFLSVVGGGEAKREGQLPGRQNPGESGVEEIS